MGIFKVEGLILRARKYGEADTILTLFTKEQGKLSVLAKGVRKPKSKLRSVAQFLTWGNFLLADGRNFKHLSQGEAFQSFGYILDDFELLMGASYLVELIESVLPEEEPNVELYQLLISTLTALKYVDRELLFRAFEFRLFNQMGVRPQLKACVECGSVPTTSQVKVSPRLGGVLCRLCSHRDTFSLTVNRGSATIAERLAQLDLRSLTSLRLTKEQLADLERLAKGLVKEHIKHRVKSMEVISGIEAEDS